MKGLFYSVIVLLFLAPLVLLMITHLNHTPTTSVTKVLGDRMVSFSSSINNDLARADYIIARRAIDAAATSVDATGVPLDDAELRLSELMVNGTLYGNLSTVDFTLNSWILQLQQKGQVYGFTTNITLINLSIKPLDSYDLLVSLQLTVNATDKSGAMRLNRLYSQASVIPITNIPDPLYTLKTNGIIKRTIIAPNLTVYGQPAVDKAVASEFYLPSAGGPSFLDRLEGRLTSKYAMPNIGLETFVNLPELQANGLPVKIDQSSVDYLYFDPTTQSGVPVNSSSSWLRLDAPHRANYGV